MAYLYIIIKLVLCIKYGCRLQVLRIRVFISLVVNGTDQVVLNDFILGRGWWWHRLSLPWCEQVCQQQKKKAEADSCSKSQNYRKIIALEAL